jgi:acyl-coenzyme A synthetase/AMP-(fatty) acid ligase
MAAMNQSFQGVTTMNCYGASETGVVSLDREPGNHFHVGASVAGKPVWIEDADVEGVGRLATAGVDCREFYWPNGEVLRRPDGAVAATDLAHIGDDGNIYLDGRIDGSEKLHGITIYPRRIERHILSLNDVVDVAVSVIVSENGADHLKAHVVGSVSPELVREWCRSLPSEAQPSIIECVSDDLSLYEHHGKLQARNA